MKPGISAIVIVYNQVELLKKCLDSLKDWVNEIVIVDLESKDDIEKVAKQYKAIYKKHPHVPVVEHVREKVLKLAKYEYVVFIDPDEEIPVDLARSIKEKVASREYDYFATPRKNIVLQSWMKNNRWWPDYQIRIFKNGKVAWPTKLHQQPIYKGVGYTYSEDEKYAILHTNYRSMDEWFEKNQRYAKTDAKDRYESGASFTLLDAMKLSVSEMISRFFAGKGYKDGIHGLIFAILQSFYYYLVYAYYWERKGYEQVENEKAIKAFPRTWFKHALSETLYWDGVTKNKAQKIKEKVVRRLIA